MAEIKFHYSPTARAGVIRCGYVTGLFNLTRYYLRSAAKILYILVMDANFDAERLHLLIQLKEGISAAMLKLLELPVKLSCGEVIDLYRQGLPSLSKVETFDKNVLGSVLGRERAIDLLDRVLEVAQSISSN